MILLPIPPLFSSSVGRREKKLCNDPSWLEIKRSFRGRKQNNVSQGEDGAWTKSLHPTLFSTWDGFQYRMGFSFFRGGAEETGD